MAGPRHSKESEDQGTRSPRSKQVGRGDRFRAEEGLIHPTFSRGGGDCHGKMEFYEYVSKKKKDGWYFTVLYNDERDGVSRRITKNK